MMPLMTEAARSQQITAFFVRLAPSDLCHFSIPVILLAAIGLCAGGPVGLVLGLAALSTAMVAISGPGSLLFEIYKAMPGAAMFRFPARMLVLTALFTAVAAALGGTWLAGIAPRRRLVEWAALAIVVAVLVVPYRVIGLAPFAGEWLTRSHPWFVPDDQRPPDAYRAWVPSGRFDLGMGTFVRQGMRHGVRIVQDYEAASGRRLGAFLSAAAGRPPRPADDVVLFTGALLDDPPIERPGLLDLVSARTIMLPESAVPKAPVPAWTEIARHPRYVVYRNDRALPRAYLVHRARFVPDEAAALDAIVDVSFDAHAEAVLVGAPDTPEARAVADGLRVPAESAQIAVDEPERVVIDVAPSRPSVLVLADAFAAGWSARVDGAPRELRQANYLVRGVLVAPGDRRVEPRYTAPGLPLGVGVTVGAWSIALAVAAARARRGPAPESLDGP